MSSNPRTGLPENWELQYAKDSGTYRANWINTVTGVTVHVKDVSSSVGDFWVEGREPYFNGIDVIKRHFSIDRDPSTEEEAIESAKKWMNQNPYGDAEQFKGSKDQIDFTEQATVINSYGKLAEKQDVKGNQGSRFHYILNPELSDDNPGGMNKYPSIITVRWKGKSYKASKTNMGDDVAYTWQTQQLINQ